MTAAASLPDALRAHACGLHSLQAASELLIGHGTWLHHDDFLRHVHDVPGPAGGTPIATIDWTKRSPASTRGGYPAPAASAACCASPHPPPTESRRSA